MQKRFRPKRNFFKSFGYAFNGIAYMLRAEPNMRWHFASTLVVFLCGFYFEISVNEWLIVILTVGMVWFAEAVNTVIEMIVDKYTPEHDPVIGKIKDVAAGAVLLTSFTAAAVGAIIFLPKIIILFQK